MRCFRAVLLGLPNDVGEIENQHRHEQAALQAPDLAVQNQRKEQRRNDDHHDHLPHHDLRGDVQRPQNRTDPQDEADICQVGPHHVTDGEIGVALQGRYDRDHQFGSRRAHGDNRKAYDDRAHAERAGKPRSAPDEPFGPEIQNADAPDEKQDVSRHALVP